jgi:hypothetical protein
MTFGLKGLKRCCGQVKSGADQGVTPIGLNETPPPLDRDDLGSRRDAACGESEAGPDRHCLP